MYNLVIYVLKNYTWFWKTWGTFTIDIQVLLSLKLNSIIWEYIHLWWWDRGSNSSVIYFSLRSFPNEKKKLGLHIAQRKKELQMREKICSQVTGLRCGAVHADRLQEQACERLISCQRRKSHSEFFARWKWTKVVEHDSTAMDGNDLYISIKNINTEAWCNFLSVAVCCFLSSL